MLWLNKTESENRWHLLIAGLIVAVLTGCGGGADNSAGAVPGLNSSNGSGAAATAPKMTLVLTDPSGNVSNLVTVSKSLKVTATVRNAAGQPLANTLVAFSTDANLTVLAPASATVLTDANGVAEVRLSPLSLTSAGAGTVNAAVTIGDGAIQSHAVYSLGAAAVSLSLVTPTATPSLLKAYGSSVITLDVLSNGVLLADNVQSITLASACVAAGKATLPAQVTTINGRAQVVYRDLGCAQADVVTASVAGAAATMSIGFQISAPDAASIEVGTVLPADRSIVIKGAGGSARSETATVKFRVVDQFGNALANQKVTFATISTKSVTLNKTSDVTDALGEVVTTVNAGTEPTALRVQATLASGLSTISDTITVTTGLPVISAFSLSSESFNIEGFNYDNIQTNILLLLADQFGNPVADGTPVVFQTDSGAIGTSDRGGCTTVNGSCSVPLRSQNPRFDTDATAPQGRAGLATISVSTSDNSNVPLSGRIAVFFSGSFASRMTATAPGLGTVPVTGTGIALTTDACDAVQVQLRLNDQNNNPMPEGTTLSSTNAAQLAAALLPESVPSIAPRYTNGVVTGAQGSLHVIVLIPDASVCKVGGNGRSSGSALITITTPRNNVTTFPIKLNFPS